MREAASFISSQTQSQPGLLATFFDGLRAAARSWANRRKLARLTEFDDHLLADIGLSRDDVRVALDLPFAQDPALDLQRRATGQRARGWRVG